MILDNSGIDYSQMFSFVFDFLVYWEIEPNSLITNIFNFFKIFHTINMLLHMFTNLTVIHWHKKINYSLC